MGQHPRQTVGGKKQRSSPPTQQTGQPSRRGRLAPLLWNVQPANATLPGGLPRHTQNSVHPGSCAIDRFCLLRRICIQSHDDSRVGSDLCAGFRILRFHSVNRFLRRRRLTRLQADTTGLWILLITRQSQGLQNLQCLFVRQSGQIRNPAQRSDPTRESPCGSTQIRRRRHNRPIAREPG
jgi:hypothetical protein